MSAGAAPSRWLFGPAADLLLGCGVLYMLVAAFAAVGVPLREAQPDWLFPFLVLALSTPHYGATLVRAYERGGGRARALFTVDAPIVIGLAFLAGVHFAAFGALLFTLYLTWSPWHYTGQNYGIALMFLRRRGIQVEPGLKRWIHASFVLSFALPLLVLHGERAADTVVPVAYVAGQVSPVHFLRLGIPRALTVWAVPALGLAYLAAVAVCLRALLQRARLRDLLPFAVLLVSQALWLSLPFAILFWQIETPLDPLNANFESYYTLWIALAHAAQYLWITAYYARAGGAEGTLRHYGKALAAGSAAWLLPWLFVAPGALGLTESQGLLAPAGASVLILAAAVNIHHFILDGAIWKLRQPRVANVLIASGAADAPARSESGRPVLRALVWAGCAAALVVSLVSVVEATLLFPRAVARGDYDGARASARRLAWSGQDRADLRRVLGDALAAEGRTRLALEQYERSAALAPTGLAYLRIGQLRAARRDWEGALAAYERGLALRPDAANLLRGAAVAAARLGRKEDARAFRRRSLAVEPERAPRPSAGRG